jgi:hypothetical protein
MSCSTTLNKLKKVMAVATVLAAISCLVPESAQAVRAKLSGTPAANPRIDIFELEINLNARPSNPNNNENEIFFSEAITNFRGVFAEEGRPEPLENIRVPLNFSSGDLTVSFLSQSDLKSNLESFGDPLITFENLTENTQDPNASVFNNGAVKYEATFSQSPLTLSLFAPCPDNQSTCQSWINSLSNLQQFPPIQVVAQFPYPVGHPMEGVNFIQLNRLSLTEVIPDAPNSTDIPEADATASLLGFGALGAAWRLKHLKRSRKLQESQNSVVKNQEVA